MSKCKKLCNFANGFACDTPCGSTVPLSARKFQRFDIPKDCANMIEQSVPKSLIILNDEAIDEYCDKVGVILSESKREELLGM